MVLGELDSDRRELVLQPDLCVHGRRRGSQPPDAPAGQGAVGRSWTPGNVLARVLG